MNLAASIVLFACVAACGIPRWLRVAQREHYLPGRVTRFWTRWLGAGPVNAVLGALLLALAVIGAFVSPVLLACAAAVVVWPIGLPIRGRSMRPLLGRGARILVTPSTRARFGDLLAYECEGVLVCHRVISQRGAAMLTRADHRGAGPEIVTAAQIVGVVAAFERGGVTVGLLTFRRRTLATLAAVRSFAAAAWPAMRRRWQRA